MQNKSYWIWHNGEYEIFHAMNLHLKREERGLMRPPFWKVAMPYATVKFKKCFESEEGYLVCHINGEGYVELDGRHYPEKTRIALTRGAHTLLVHTCKPGGLPAIFIESDVCPSDGSFVSNYFAGEFLPVGYLAEFCRADRNPEEFPFAYERLYPVAKETVGDGALYDFGRELFGYLNVAHVSECAEMNVFYGESREEALDTEYSYLTDRIEHQKSARLRQRAFRYVYIQNAPVDLEVSVDYEYLPLEQKGSFRCDRPLFNEIFSVAAYTFHLNCREAFLDGIKRDRWVWSGDAYQSARINKYLFADREIEQRTLLGLIGKEPIEQHINTILDYSLLWIIALYEHYMAYGDLAFLRRIYPMAESLLAFCEMRLNEDGLIEGQGDDWTFIDWSEIEKIGAVAAEQMLLIRVYAVMAEMATALGEESQKSLFEKSEALKVRVNEFYWNEEKGAFIDSYRSGNAHVTRHANIFAIMYGIASEAQAQSILKNVLKNENVTKITTPYFEGYELDALAKLGEFSALEEMIASYWGGMIALGATSVWEEYHPEMNGIEHYSMYGGKYEKSLCHAWGAGPIYLFGRYYLGVSESSAGYETFTVAPNLGGLQEISGTVPINGGTVTVSLTKEKLAVTASKAGGTLVWKNRRYTLLPNEELVLTF